MSAGAAYLVPTTLNFGLAITMRVGSDQACVEAPLGNDMSMPRTR